MVQTLILQSLPVNVLCLSDFLEITQYKIFTNNPTYTINNHFQCMRK